MEQYQQNLNQMYAFADQRPEKQRTHLDEKFDLGGWQTVSFINENPEGGKLKINTIYVDKDYFRGSFFNDIKVVVTAIPADGYEFDGWEGTDKKESQISFMPGDLSKGVKVKFKKINQ